MITEQQAREAAESRAVETEESGGWEISKDEKTLIDFAMQELARREAERIERAKPITSEWIREIESSTPRGHAWQVLRRFNVGIYETEIRACVYSSGECKVSIYQQGEDDQDGIGEFCDCVLIGKPSTRGQLLDLLAALKGGET